MSKIICSRDLGLSTCAPGTDQPSLAWVVRLASVLACHWLIMAATACYTCCNFLLESSIVEDAVNTLPIVLHLSDKGLIQWFWHIILHLRSFQRFSMVGADPLYFIAIDRKISNSLLTVLHDMTYYTFIDYTKRTILSYLDVDVQNVCSTIF